MSLFENLEFVAEFDLERLQALQAKAKQLIERAEDGDSAERVAFRAEAERVLKEAKAAGRQLTINLETIEVFT